MLSVGHLASSLFLLYIKKNFHETKFNKRHGEGHIHECLLLAENRAGNSAEKGREVDWGRKSVNKKQNIKTDVDTHVW